MSLANSLKHETGYLSPKIREAMNSVKSNVLEEIANRISNVCSI